MSQINVDSDDKEWFDSFKEDGENQAEAFSRLVRTPRPTTGS